MKIVKKRFIEDNRDYYDLSIEGTHNFCLAGGEVVHNCGVGFSVQSHHVEKLPEIRKPDNKKYRKFLINDSIEGWSDAIKVLMKSYFYGGSSIRFVYDDIRPKGARLITSGGKAPGPEPLRLCVEKIRSILNDMEDGTKLEPIQVHDIICHIADAVLAGGIRRAALISLFSLDDNEMISCKSGNWWELNPQRGRANNSAVILRHRVEEEDFFKLWDRIKASGSGEPGIYFSNDKEFGTNPCVEISLKPFSFCNLTEVNISNIESQEDLNNRVKAASFIGTLQASYTDFHYLRPIWQKTTEKDSLIGVGLTGIGSNEYSKYDLKEASDIVKDENKRVADIIGINSAARTTCVKPSGTASIVMGCSSGIHAWHNDYYIRRIRVMKNESMYSFLLENHPELLEDDTFRPHDTAIISIPQKAPENSILRTESALELLNRVKNVYRNWVKPGHRRGQNTNNISATVSIKDDEWYQVGEWMWKNRNFYNGISVLPYDGGTYTQAPFEDITEEEYNDLMDKLHNIDLSKIVEIEDNTDLAGELACAGGSCEIY